MKFSDTRPPVNDGSQYLRFSTGELLKQAFSAGFEPYLPPKFGKDDLRPMHQRYAAARLRVVMRDPADYAAATPDERRRWRNARKKERRAK